jgi:Outer membrane protein beta-barrel domain
MKKSFLTLLLIFIIYSINTAAQDNDLSIIVKFGQSDFHNSGLSRDNTHNLWENGLQFSAGIEKRLSSSFSVQGLFSFSIESFAQNYTLYQVNDAKNRVYDLMGNMKLNIGKFYLLGGVGVSYQKSDEVRYLDSGMGIILDAASSTALFAAKEKFIFAGLLGAGLDINIYKQINLITEADINLREYTGTSLLIGVKYSL